MEKPEPTTWCAQRRVSLAIGEATFAIDALASQAAMGSGAAGARLLTRPIAHPWPRTPSAPARRYAGPLAIHPLLLPVRVELALGPWSSSVSELSARPLTRRPPEWRATAYWPTVHMLLDDLALKLESIALVGRKVGHDAMPQVIATLAA